MKSMSVVKENLGVFSKYQGKKQAKEELFVNTKVMK